MRSDQLQSDRRAARALFGPWSVPAHEVWCRLCYRDHLWRSWRGLAVVLGALGVVFGVAGGGM